MAYLENDPFKVSFSKVEIITVAKVGSSNFLHSLKAYSKIPVNHGHSLMRLRQILKHNANTLVIVGVRNPIDRGLSYLFQTASDKTWNGVKTLKNGYRGEWCYITVDYIVLKVKQKFATLMVDCDWK